MSKTLYKFRCASCDSDNIEFRLYATWSTLENKYIPTEIDNVFCFDCESDTGAYNEEIHTLEHIKLL